MANQASSTWVITPDGHRPLAEVGKAIGQSGGQVVTQLDAVGLLIVRGSAAQATRWRKLKGVLAVEADRGVDIGPPDSGVS